MCICGFGTSHTPFVVTCIISDNFHDLFPWQPTLHYARNYAFPGENSFEFCNIVTYMYNILPVHLVVLGQ
jgi:hypothetical protein